MSEKTPQGTKDYSSSSSSGGGLLSVIKPITRTIRTRAGSASLIMLLATTGALAYFNYLNQKDDTPVLTTEEDCRAYLPKAKYQIPGCPPCISYCEEVIACAEAKRSRSIDSLQQYLRDYAGKSEAEPCYSEARALLDSLLCDKMQSSPEAAAENCRAYMDEFGLGGRCYSLCWAVLDSLACEAARKAADKDQAYRKYQEDYCPNGRCCDDFGNEERECRLLLENPAGKTCQDYVAYLTRYGLDGLCAAQALDTLLIRDKLKIDTAQARRDIGQCIAGKRALAHTQEQADSLARLCYQESMATWPSLCVKGQEGNGKRIDDNGGGGGSGNGNDNGGGKPDCGPGAVRLGSLYLRTESWNNGKLYTWGDARRESYLAPGWRLPCESDIRYIINKIYRRDPANAYRKLVYHSKCPVNTGGGAVRFWCMTESSDDRAWSFEFDPFTESVRIVSTDKRTPLPCLFVRGRGYGDCPAY